MSDGAADRPTVRDWIDRLRERGWVDESDLPSLEDRIEEAVGTDDSMVVRAVVFGGAWLSAYFVGLLVAGLAALIGLPPDIVEHWAFWLVAGAGVSELARRLDGGFGDGDFVEHLAGAFGVAGLVGLAVGVGMLGVSIWEDVLRVQDPAPSFALWLAPMAALCLAAVARDVFGRDRSYLQQLTFATSVIGQVIAVGIVYLMADASTTGMPDSVHFLAMTTEAGLAAWLYGVYDNWLHRFVSAAAVVMFALIGIFDAWGPIGAIFEPGGRVVFAVLFGLLTVGFTVVFAPMGRMDRALQWRLRPVGYVCALGIALLSSELLLVEVVGSEAMWPYRGVLAAAAVVFVYGAVDSAEFDTLEPAAWGAGTAVVLAVVSTPGVMAGLTILAAGLWHGRRDFRWLGFVTLGFHLVVFYYLMEITLFDKSLMLMGTGAALVALRVWFVRRPWYRLEEES